VRFLHGFATHETCCDGNKSIRCAHSDHSLCDLIDWSHHLRRENGNDALHIWVSGTGFERCFVPVSVRTNIRNIFLQMKDTDLSISSVDQPQAFQQILLKAAENPQLKNEHISMKQLLALSKRSTISIDLLRIWDTSLLKFLQISTILFSD
jgi:hypothetical protein